MENETQETLAFELAMIHRALFSDDVDDADLERAAEEAKCTNH